jgi:hypothetical protein
LVQEMVVVQTLLCSTKLTQNLDLMSLLKWRSHPDRKDPFQICESIQGLQSWKLPIPPYPFFLKVWRIVLGRKLIFMYVTSFFMVIDTSQ